MLGAHNGSVSHHTPRAARFPDDRGCMMPPAGMPRPDAATFEAFVSRLETTIDRAAAARPRPGRTALHRLNRAEYANAIRDLLSLEIDATALLPPDDESSGFDNIADVLTVSPSLMERYLSAAWNISRIALGNLNITPSTATYRVRPDLSQDQQLEGLPPGTRGGMRSTTCLLGCLLIGVMPALASAGTSDAADAAQRNDIAALRSMVSKRVDVNAPQPDGTTALHWAAHWNDVEAVKLLIGAGAHAATTNRFGASPLSEAATSGNADLVKVLLDAGADAKALSTPDGETVLMSAARTGNVDAVRLLLDRGADVNARERYKGQTALMWAAAERHAPVVKLLLERGADWRIRGFDRETKPPKLSAASAISPIPRGGFTALMFTAREGDLESAAVMTEMHRDRSVRGHPCGHTFAL